MEMHSLTVSGSHVIRLYLWAMIRKYMRESWSPLTNAHGAEVPPIIPTQEQPEVQQSENPYMVYAYNHDMTSDLWQLQGETMAITVYSQSHARTAATTKFMKRLFNKWDESARDVNRWIHDQSDDEHNFKNFYGTGNPDYDKWMDEVKNFQFKFIRLSGVMNTQPGVGEGRRVDTTVSLELQYVEKEMELETNN